MGFMCSWVNGEKTDKLDCLDRGLAFGDGVFETVLIQKPSNIVLLDFHLARLERSCSRLSINFVRSDIEKDLLDVVALIQQHPEVNQWRLKIIVTRGNSNTGYAYKTNLQNHRYFILSEFVADLVLIQEKGVSTRICDWLISRQPQLAGIKHLNRLDQVMARREWQDTAIYEGFLKDDQGNLIEGTCTNLFIVSDKKLITPILDNSGVEGVMKRFVIDKLCEEVSLDCREAVVKSFDRADEVFITNALVGIVPVVSVNNKEFPVGSVTRSLQVAFQRHVESGYEK